MTTTSSSPWRKSSRSGDCGACVEVARSRDGAVRVRDSKDPTGAVLSFSPAAWTAFAGRPPLAARRRP
jgi:hypothetical protein